MALTTQQEATLKAFILADPVLVTKASGPGTDIEFIANALNAAASPAVKAWRTSVPQADLDDAPDYATFDNIAAGKRDSWGFLLARERDFTRNKVRKWVTDIWGSATANSNAAAILLAGTVNATRAEVVLGGVTKTTDTVSALDRAWIGTLGNADIAEILANA